jgi:transposase
MLTVDHYARIRQLRRDGLTIRQIAAQTHHSPKTILKALAHPEPPPAASTARAAPVFGPFRDVAEAILAEDETAPRKQRHTASQLFRRLRAEYGYTGGYDQVRRYLRDRRRDHRETFIPLDHPPGQRAEADFGHIQVDFPDGRRPVPVLLVTWSYSNGPFALALPTERTEAILHGLVEAFAFFGCVPRELWWDNPTTVAIAVWRGRQRALHPRYAALTSHYTFTAKFCLPARGQEKPRVENRVWDLQRRWGTPVPRVTGLAELNAHLRRCCLAERERVSGGHPDTIGVRFERDRAAALPVPEGRFDACVLQAAQVDKYQTVRFDHNSYSVPRRWAFRPVTVKGYVDHVEVVAGGQVVARHGRSYGRAERVLDPLHYLVTLERKPAALDHAPVYRDWRLPPAFAELRRSLEQRLGAGTGARHFIRVLQLLAHHPVGRVEEAIRVCRGRVTWDAAAITAQVERLTAATASPSPAADTPLSLDGPYGPSSDRGVSAAGLAALRVPAPDVSRFNRLLSSGPQGDLADDATDRPAAEGQPQAAETADHARRVGATGP